jgi:hypothetical protein
MVQNFAPTSALRCLKGAAIPNETQVPSYTFRCIAVHRRTSRLLYGTWYLVPRQQAAGPRGLNLPYDNRPGITNFVRLRDITDIRYL